MDRTKWRALKQDDRKRIIKVFDTQYTSIGTWGNDYIAGMVTSDEPTTRDNLQKYMEDTAKRLSRESIVKKITIDECTFPE